MRGIMFPSGGDTVFATAKKDIGSCDLIDGALISEFFPASSWGH